MVCTHRFYFVPFPEGTPSERGFGLRVIRYDGLHPSLLYKAPSGLKIMFGGIYVSDLNFLELVSHPAAYTGSFQSEANRFKGS